MEEASFGDAIAYGEAPEHVEFVQRFLKREKGVVSFRARESVEVDRAGTDWYYTDKKSREHAADLKTRSREGRVWDVAVEVWCDVAKGWPGWSVDPQKVTDLLVYYYPPSQTIILFDYKKYRSCCIN